MMVTNRWFALLALPVLLLFVQGCNGQFTYDNVDEGGGNPGSSFDRDTAITTSLGEAYLEQQYQSETIAVRDSSTDRSISGIQLLGIADVDRRLYVAADPNHRYHPTITSGESSSYYDGMVYMTPVDQRLGTNATSYPRIDGYLLNAMAREYGHLSSTVTVNGLRDKLTSLAYGKTAGLVVCTDRPLNSSVGSISVTEVAQQGGNLDEAFQGIGWQYIFTNNGFTSYQNVNVWVIDPYELGINAGSSGALYNTLLVVVAPTSNSTGTVLPDGLKVELTWDAPVDLDLHLVRNGADLYDTTDDCFWKYLEQNWGSLYQVNDNPRILYDNRSGYGPEMVVLNEMTAGDQYTVAVDYWGDAEGNASHTPTNATVRVWTNGSASPRTFQVSGFTYGAPETGQYKVVCDIDGSTGQVTIGDRGLSRAVTRSLGGKKK